MVPTTVPLHQSNETPAEALRLALLDGAPADLTGAAVTLLTDTGLHAREQLAPYIDTVGDLVARVAWGRLTADLLDGTFRMERRDRSMVWIAVQLAGPLGGALSTNRDRIPLVIAALQHAAGEW